MYWIVICLLLLNELAYGQNLSPETAAKLREKISFWTSYGDTCDEFWSFPSKREEDGRCDDGDSVLFNAMLCMATYQPACAAVRDSLDNSGQWWRSPRQVGGALRERNSFSRDMTMGVLLYLVKTNDVEAARRWLDWLTSNRKPVRVGSLDIASISFLCHDDENYTCAMTPGVWENFGKVWISLGLPPTRNMRQPYSQFGELGSFSLFAIDRFGSDWQDIARFELRNTEPGYQMHLKGVLAYLVQKINQKAGLNLYDTSALSNELVRLQPRNPFFRYLKEGPSEQLAETLISLCPNESTVAPKRQWSWERADSSEAWRKSMGWDCVFLGKLLLGDDSFPQPVPRTLTPGSNGSVPRVIESIPVEESAEVMAESTRRLQRLDQICEERVRDAIATSKRVTGVSLSYEQPLASDLQNAQLDQENLRIRGVMSCQYLLKIN